MQDNVIEAAHLYAVHAEGCALCNGSVLGGCEEGDKLLSFFYDALHEMLNEKPYDA